MNFKHPLLPSILQDESKIPEFSSFPRAAWERSQGALRREFTLVPKLLLGNPDGEAPASRDGKLELPALNSQAGAWELAKVGIYDDMLNIVSPGGLPNGLTQADLQQGRSEIRNRVLARVFKELGYIEQWGSGIGRIKAMCREADNAEPKIQERGDFVDWAFYRSTISSTEPVTGSEKSSEKMSEKMSEKIVRFIQANPNITIDELSKLAEVSTRTIERNLKSLQADDRIRRIGPAKGGYWEVMV